jgi:hypothetical protein
VSDKDGPNGGNQWPLLLGLLGASVGFTFVLYVLGTIAETSRFHALKLPGDQTITAVSHDPLVVIGGRTLAPPLMWAVSALALFYILVALGRRETERRDARGDASDGRGDTSKKRVALPVRSLAAVGAVFVGAAVAVGVVVHAQWWNYPIVAVATVSVAVLGLWHLRPKDLGAHSQVLRTGAAVGLVAAGVVGTVALYDMWTPPVHLEFAEVHFVGGGQACGIFLTLTSDDIYLAPATEEDDTFYTHRRVAVLPRSNVESITLSPRVPVSDDRRGADGGADKSDLACVRQPKR